MEWKLRRLPTSYEQLMNQAHNIHSKRNNRLESKITKWRALRNSVDLCTKINHTKFAISIIYLSVRKLVLSREILSSFTPASNKMCSNSTKAMDHIRLCPCSFSGNRSTKLGDKALEMQNSQLFRITWTAYLLNWEDLEWCK